jgi:hypothetical protein
MTISTGQALDVDAHIGDDRTLPQIVVGLLQRELDARLHGPRR